MLRILTLVSLTIVSGACSIVTLHPDAADALRAMRVLGGVTIENKSRWTLPRFAEVTVAHSDGRKDNERLLAVQTGLSRYLQIEAVESTWRIDVHWPDPVFRQEGGSSPTSESSEMRSSPSAQSAVTHTTDGDVVLVDVVHVVDNSVVTHLEVEIEPWLGGRDWHDPVSLTRTFTAVGAALTGS